MTFSRFFGYLEVVNTSSLCLSIDGHHLLITWTDFAQYCGIVQIDFLRWILSLIWWVSKTVHDFPLYKSLWIKLSQSLGAKFWFIYRTLLYLWVLITLNCMVVLIFYHILGLEWNHLSFLDVQNGWESDLGVNLTQ